MSEQYYHAIHVQSWYGPKQTVNFTEWGSHGDPEPLTLDEALAMVAERETGDYTLSHNEAGRPDDLIVPSELAEYILHSGDYECSWDGFEGDCDGCGDCDRCWTWIEDASISELRNGAVDIDALRSAGGA
jgi:hypothetical protein